MTLINSNLFKYTAFGLKICSEIFLPELAHSNFSEADLIIRFGKVDIGLGKSIVEGTDFKITDENIYRFWDQIGKFKIIKGSEIIVDPVINSERILRSFILGTVLASLLYQRGLLVLHASAVNLNNKAVAFLGDKGYGKSTTAMAFYKRGYPILADDYITIDFKDKIPLVYPGFPSLRLSHKSRVYGGFNPKRIYFKGEELDKIHVPAINDFINNKIPLKQIYVIKRGNELKINNLNPQESLIELIKNTFGVNRFRKSDFELNLGQCAKILEYADLSVLEVPDSLEKLYKIVDIVKGNIQ